MPRTSVWAVVAEGPRMPLGNLSEQDQATEHRKYFINNVLFSIRNNVKLLGDGNPGVSFHARTLDLVEETVQKIKELIWESDICDKSSEFAHYIINCCINLNSKLWLHPGMTWWQRLRFR